ncbi:GCN5-related N-acetyltransferase [[Leptolyngbya] sp. PCC 7376]|uniref:GNAT family N-acetyltransferase n=1 Tax=[Leptolyngbya] sp. PCC 7376 TaxID=111781 RepID=UPI00029EE7D0|nr:GNAT family N-acetyltransferase [[Leptolyngbya] sp. PCC 7376]AFY40593.1 GCN5-related N-acetyltransferase [[Leptolyngbya] sp. PCC 7376]
MAILGRETERLKLRLWEPERDAIAAHEIYGDPEVMQFIRAPEQNLASTAKKLLAYREMTLQTQQKTGIWAVVEKTTNTPIGSILLVELPDNHGDRRTGDFEIGWHFRKASWGKGFAFEAATHLLNYGLRELKLPIIYAVLREGNWRSQRLAERLHMEALGKTDKYYNTTLLLFGYQSNVPKI